VPASRSKSEPRKGDELAVAAAGQEGCLHQRARARLAGIDEPLGFGMREVADLRRTRVPERFDPSPSFVALCMSLAEGQIERGLEYPEDAVGGGATLADRVRIVAIELTDNPEAAQPGGRLSDREMPRPDRGRRQGLDLARAELGPDEGVRGDFQAVERLPPTPLIVGDVIVKAAVDRVRAGRGRGVERGEPVPRLRLGLGVIEDALAVGIKRVVGRAERRLPAVRAVDGLGEPHPALGTLAVADGESAADRNPIG
jgi:hypothetical protein